MKKMKQTDKCECGHYRINHLYKKQSCILPNCKCKKFKSYSQTDKCEYCGFVGWHNPKCKSRSQNVCCVCEGYNPDNQEEPYYCEEHKSRSQNLPEQLERLVRASEEEKLVSNTNTPVNSTSSVPYTPLTKAVPIKYRLIQGRAYPGGTWCSFCGKELCMKEHFGYEDKQVLSALKGLKMDNCHNVIFRKYPKYCDICEACKSINKWFPIIEEVKRK